MAEFKKVVAVVAGEVASGTVTDIFHVVRRRCPEWAVTPHRVRKALNAIEKRRGGKHGNKRSKSSNDGSGRAFPHDVVELRPHAGRARHAHWQWRGQVLRVAGYDDGETMDEEDQELPPGHCLVFWLGHALEQWPNVLTKESSVRVLDRPWVLGDRVAWAEDPRSLGTVVGVCCNLKFPAVSLTGSSDPAPSVLRPVQNIRAVGGFRAEDWVAHDDQRWVGKVEEAVFRVEVELCGKSERQRARSCCVHKPPACVFEVISEGMQGLEPAGGEDVTEQELCPHFPGQKIKAPARLWRQAEWLRGGLGRRSPRRGVPICGVVTSVDCSLLAVRWLAGVVKDSKPPDEWVSPDKVHVLTVPNSSEGWAVGDHVQHADSEGRRPSSVIVESSTTVTVRWADGTTQENVPSLRLCPRPHISAHDFLPCDFVTRSGDGFSEPPQVGGQSVGMDTVQDQNPDGNYPDVNMENDVNTDHSVYGYPGEAQDAENISEILPTDAFIAPQADTALGVVTSVNLQARTALVQWAGPRQGRLGELSVQQPAGEPEEVSVFELTDHPQVDVRLGDAVLIPDAATLQWAGRVYGLDTTGQAQIEMMDGSSQTHDVRKLVVVGDGEDSESSEDGMVSDGEGSTRSDGVLSEIAEGQEMENSEEEVHEDEGEGLEKKEPQDVDSTSTNMWRSSSAPVLKVEAQDSLRPDLRGLGRLQRAEHVDDNAEIAGPTEGPRAMELEGGGGSTSSSTKPKPSHGSFEFPAFDVCSEDVEPTDHFFFGSATLGTRALMAAVRREMIVLRKGLLEGSEEGCAAPIVVRTYSSRTDLFRAMVVGPPDTPYANVPFFFDLSLPAEYPREPPHAHFHANFVGNERLNPNLYVDGKVCLSLLGTWSGPSWDPQRSTLLQVLVSLQGLVLVEEPYFNEPGHECDMGTEQGRQGSALYNEHARLLALRAALNVSQNPPSGFKEIVALFFTNIGPKLVRECEEALQEPRASQSSAGFRKVLANSLLPRLRERWG